MSAPNRLARETSPYLLQHAHNPVDWYPWGEEALERAKREDKPILLSIGYAACHWCHVMERESFENEAIAALMNEHFVCIKVDREERPDLDDIYMQATVAMSGSGGWPMTVFLTPDDREPFFAGTYFPPSDKYGRPGFATLLQRIDELWQRERHTLRRQAAELTAALRRQAAAAAPANVGEAALEAAVAQLSRSYDERWGGFGGAPKFPPAMSLELLLRHHRRSGAERSLAMVRGTLDAMARGGMRDHLGGGFARYATDERWLVPHFEKMLYDNALLARVYAHAHQVMGRPEDAEVVAELCDYVLREMTAPEGGFFSATDADSEGVEGKFFVWTPDEIEAVLPPDQARAFSAYYDVTPQGNWEGHSILNTPRSKEEVAADLGMSPAELAALLEPAKRKLLAARSERVAPLTDDKILTAWNALMIGSLAECGRIFGEARWIEAAARAADFLLATMRRADGGLFRTTRAGKTHIEGYLEDYAYLCDALVDLYEAGAEVRHLDAARELADRMISDFASEEGSFYATAHGHEPLIVRMRDGQDAAIPNANAMAAMALTRLSWHFGRDDYRERAIAALRSHGKLIERAPRAFATSLIAADMLFDGPAEIVLAGAREDTATLALAAEVARRYLPSKVIVWADGEARAPAELLAGKTPVAGKPSLYVCRDFSCRRPVTTPSEVGEVLDEALRLASAARARRLGERLGGAASPEATEARATKSSGLETHAFTSLGRTGLTSSRIGFGGYRVDDREPVFEESLKKALRAGINLIDTSSNYADGGSERLVGAVITELVTAGEMARDELIVVSKVGYAQGENLALAKARKAEGRPFPEMVELSDDLWHGLHPEFLADQLERSLDRLNLDTLDVLLLHNPEYFLAEAEQRGGVTPALRDELYRRIEAAFGWLESQVAAGRLGAYGVSSNTLAEAASSREATDLARLIAAAEHAGGSGHHFRMIQLPVNLLESRAVLGEPPLLEAARAAGLAVLANRPLNAIGRDGLVRLAALAPDEPGARSFDQELAALRTAEEALVQAFGEAVSIEGASLADLFAWGRQLAPLDGRLTSFDQLEQVAQGQILPHIGRAMALVEQALPSEDHPRWLAWRDRYLGTLDRALIALRQQIVARTREHLDRIAAALDPVLPLARQGAPMQQKALAALTSTPGVDVVLLGMRRPEYVDDALAVLSWPPLRDPKALFAALQAK